MNVTTTTTTTAAVCLVKAAPLAPLTAFLLTVWLLGLRLALWGDKAWDLYDAFDNTIPAMSHLFS